MPRDRDPAGLAGPQRAIFFWKCAELERPDCRPRLGASTLTLGGLLKHLSIVEAAAT